VGGQEEIRENGVPRFKPDSKPNNQKGGRRCNGFCAHTGHECLGGMGGGKRKERTYFGETSRTPAKTERDRWSRKRGPRGRPPGGDEKTMPRVNA